jgi:hypothetical protein
MAAGSEVYVLGGYQTDFARNWTKENKHFSALMRESVQGRPPRGRLRVGWHRHPRGDGRDRGRPLRLRARGRRRAGAQRARRPGGPSTSAPRPGSATRAKGVVHMWPHMFSLLADEYDARYGLDDRHLAAIGELNFRNAKSNPNAQTRAGRTRTESFAPPTTPPTRWSIGRMRRHDCSQVTDGGAGLVLASRRTPRRWAAPAAARSTRAAHRRLGPPHRRPAARRQAGALAERAVRHAPRAPRHHRRVRRAGIADVSGIDGIETHDCFTSSEYMAIDHFGITAPGESWKAVEGGVLERDGSTPVNPSRRPHRRRPPGRRHRRAHGRRRLPLQVTGQAGHRRRRSHRWLGHDSRSRSSRAGRVAWWAEGSPAAPAPHLRRTLNIGGEHHHHRRRRA